MEELMYWNDWDYENAFSLNKVFEKHIKSWKWTNNELISDIILQSNVFRDFHDID